MATKAKPHIRYNKAHVSMTIDVDQCERLDAIVTLRRLSRAAIIREAIDFYLHENSLSETMSSATINRRSAA
mgnify:CR=1 FL=1